MQRRSFLRLTGATAGAIAPTALGLGLSACLDGDAGTTGRRVSLATRAELASPLELVSAYGVRMRLESFLVSVASLTYFEGAPLEASASRAPLHQRVLEPLSIRRAHAHPGHYVAGEARGEMLEATSFDLATGPVELPSGEGTTGLVRSARIVFADPPVGPLAVELGASVVVAVATLEQGERSLRARFEATAADLLGSGVRPEVSGCPFESTTLEGDGAVVLGVDTSVIFEQLELDPDLEAEGEAPLKLPRESLAFRTFARGLKKTSAYRFHFEG